MGVGVRGLIMWGDDTMLDNMLNSVLVALGGLSGLLLVAYMLIMAFYTRKRSRDVEELRLDVRELKGLLLGLKRR